MEQIEDMEIILIYPYGLVRIFLEIDFAQRKKLLSIDSLSDVL